MSEAIDILNSVMNHFKSVPMNIRRIISYGAGFEENYTNDKKIVLEMN